MYIWAACFLYFLATDTFVLKEITFLFGEIAMCSCKVKCKDQCLLVYICKVIHLPLGGTMIPIFAFWSLIESSRLSQMYNFHQGEEILHSYYF